MARIAAKAAFAASALMVSATCALGYAYQGPDRSKLRIGAYFLRTQNGVTDEHVRDLKECGIDFVYDRFNAKASRTEYDLYAKYGIGAVATWVIPGKPKVPGTMEEKVPLAVYEEVSGKFRAAKRMHRVIEAIAIGDEPSALDFPYMGKAIESARRAFPECMIYLNLYPSYAFKSENTAEQTLAQLGAASYREYIDKYCQNIPLDYISYDFYLYSRENEDFIAKYYDNLLVVADACRRTNRSLWFVPQVNSCVSNLWISSNMLRFQANSAMAFGAESIAWACYAPGWWNKNVLTPEGKKTQQYEKLKTVNAELHRVGTSYMRYRNVATHFVGFPADCADLAGMPVKSVRSLAAGSFSSIRSEDGGKIIVGEMVSRNGGGDAIFICAADDPYDKANRMRTISFRVKDGCEARATGGRGAVALEKSDDGTYAFQMASSAGVLVEAVPSVAAAKVTTTRPKATDDALLNPDMGLVYYQYSNRLWCYGSHTKPGDTLDWFPGANVIYMRLPWCELEPDEGQFRWDIVDAYAQPWIAAGKQIAFRITCSESRWSYATPQWVEKAGAKGIKFKMPTLGKGYEECDVEIWDPVYDDPVFLEKLGNFAKAFARKYDGKPYVAFVDVGSFGMWGEGHTKFSSKLDQETTDRCVKIHMDLWRKAMPNTCLVVSDDVAGPRNPGPDAETMRYARSLGIGLRDDSILCCDRQHPWFHANWAAENFAATLPVVVESGHWNLLTDGRWDDEQLVDSVEAYQASFVSIHDWPERYLKLHREAVDAINRRVGYRFELREASWPDEAVIGELMEIASEWVNVGVARRYAGAFLAWTLIADNGAVAWTFVDGAYDFKDALPKLKGVERPVRRRSKVRFGYRSKIPQMNDGVWEIEVKGDPSLAGDVPTIPCGEYTLAVSLGDPDGTPRIALPLRGGRPDRRYPLGKIVLVDGGLKK